MCALNFYFANKLLKKLKLVEVQMPKVAQKLPSIKNMIFTIIVPSVKNVEGI